MVMARAQKKAPVAAESTLQKLRNLEKEHPSLPAQLKQLALLLDQPLILDESFEYQNRRAHVLGKADWALRWITKKLAADDEAASDARRSPPAWIFLANLLRILPVSGSAQTLKTNAFLKSVERALHQATPASQSYTINNASPHASKRRRLSQDGDTVPGSGEVLHAIERCFDTLDSLIREAESQGHSLEVEYLQSTLRTDGTTAARILRGYLIAAERGYLGRLGSFASVWEHRSAGPNDSTIFSQTCFVDAASYLVKLDDGQTGTESNHTEIENAIQMVEALLAKHIVLPARATFHAQRTSDKQFDSSGSDVKSLLAPYEEFVKAENQSGRPRSKAARSIASRLLGIGVRCTPLDSTRKRAIETPWLESFFINLASAAGIVLDDGTGQIEDDEVANMLCDMLQVFLRRKVPVGTLLLSRLAQSTLSWKMNNLILRLNSDVYVNASDDLLPADLWNSITKLKFPEHSDDSDYHLVKSSIIPLLMRAYASSRKLPEFLRKWREQIASQYTNEKYKISTIWQESELVISLRPLLEASLDTEQISGLVNTLHDQLVANLDSAYADTVMLNILLGSLQSTRTIIAASETITRICELCISRLSDSRSNTQTTNANQALWRLCATCSTLLLEIVPNEVAQQFHDSDLPRLALAAHETIQLAKSLKGSARESQRDTAAEALRAVGTTLDALSRRHLLSVDTPSKSKPNGVSEDDNKSEKKKKKQKAGDTDDHASDMAKISAILATDIASAKHVKWQKTCAWILVEHPLIFGVGVGREKRISVLTSIIQFQMQSDSDPSTETDQWAQRLAQKAVRHAWLLQDMKTALSQDVFGLPKMYSMKDSEQPAAAVEMLFLHFPSDLIPRPLREKTLDATYESLVEADSNLSCAVWMRRLSLSVKLLRLPHGGSNVSLKMLPVLDRMDKTILARKVHGHGRLELLSLVCETVAQSVAHCMEHPRPTSDGDEVQLMFGGLLSRMSKHMSSAHLAAVKALMRLTSDSYKDLEELQQSLYGAVCESAKKQLKNSDQADAEWRQALLEVMSSVNSEIVLDQREGTDRVLAALETSLKEQDKLDDNTQFTLQTFVAEGPHDLEAAFGMLEQAGQTVRQRNANEKQLLSAISRGQGTSIDSVARECLDNSNQKGAQALLALLLDSSSNVDWSDCSGQSGLLVGLCQQIAGNDDIQSFKHVTDAINSLLRLKTRQLSQHALEMVLGMVTRLTSPSSPSLDAQHAAFIHTRLTGIMATLLTVHRRSTRGRFHLVLPALQGLLQCMFVADTALPARSRLPQPSWISLQHRDSKGLGVTHASAISRLVTLICEPSASAVRHGHSHDGNSKQQLVDETAAARAYAGRYMGHWVLWWCECQLKGRVVDAEARDVLVQQAVASALGVVPRPVLEAQAAAGVRGEGRAVLKGVLDEWRRRGGGGGGDYRSSRRS